MTTETGPTAQHLRTRLDEVLPSLPPAALAEVSAALGALIAGLRPYQVFIFGSQGRGEAGPESDVDILVVVPDTGVTSHQRAQQAYRLVGPHTIPLDIIVITRREFEERRPARASLPATALREGALVYGT